MSDVSDMANVTPRPTSLSGVLWSGVLALLITLIVGGIWTLLLVINLATSPAVPWAVLVMALLLWGLWQYLGGAWWPQRTAARRQHLLRARAVDSPVLVWALVAGGLAILALAGLWFVLFQIAHLSATRQLPKASQYPWLTVTLALIMASLVGAVVEEAAFRGYFQGSLEQLVRAPLAILITAVVMAPEHAFTQGFVWPTAIFYLGVDIMLGTMAYLTQSILPGVVVHGMGLLLFFTLVWPGDRLRQAVGAGNTTTWLIVHLGQTVVLGILSLLAFRQLARTAQISRGHRLLQASSLPKSGEE